MNLLIITIIVLILFQRYRSGYFKGVCSSVFLLIFCPNNLSLEFGIEFPSVTASRVIILLMMVFWISNINKKHFGSGIPFFNLLILITLSLGVSNVFSENLLVSMKRYGYFIIESLLLFVIIATSINQDEDIKVLIKAITFSLLLAAFSGIAERFTGFNVTTIFGSNHAYEFEAIREAVTSSDGVISTYQHRILFGIAMSELIVFSLYQVIKSSTFLDKLLWWLSVLTASIALYYSFSRGPWLSIAAAGIMTLAARQRQFLKQFLLLGIIAISLIIIRPGVLSTLEDVYSTSKKAETVKGASMRWRFKVLYTAIDQIFYKGSAYILFFGHGDGSHLFLKFEPILLETGHYGDLTSWDNEFAVILFERGIIGFTLFVLLYLKLLSSAWRYLRKGNANGDEMLLCLLSMTIIIFMKTNVKIFAQQINYLEFISIALVSYILSIDYSKSKPLMKGIGLVE